MQENFLLKTKRAIKKVAALGVGSAMLGLTASGALAQANLDLANYPSPFVVDGQYDSSNAFVVGANAEASDTLGAVDIASNLQFEAKECSPSGDGTVSVSGGESEDVPIGSNIAGTNHLEQELDDSDLSGFIDSSINFQSADYDVSEVLELARNKNTTVQTSLTASDDDYESNVVVEIERDAIKYYYQFDESIQLNSTTSADPLEIDFLGRKIKVTDIDSGSNKLTAQVGTEFFMDIDDSVTVSGKTVTLQNVGSGGAAVVDVDGVQETLSSGVTRTVNGIEINNDEAFYTDTRSERSATLIIGEDATESYTDGDAYIGEDEDDPAWVWDLANLNTKSTTVVTNDDFNLNTTGPTIGVENEFRYVDGSDADPLFVGDCLDLPNNYASICFDSLTVADDDYLDLDITLEKGIDFTDSVAAFTNQDSIKIKSSKKETLKLKNNVLTVDNLTKDEKTDEVWLVLIPQTGGYNVSVFFRETEKNKKFFAGNASVYTGAGTNNFMEIDFKDTKDTNIAFDLEFGSTSSNGGLNVTLDIQGDSTSDDLVSGQDDIVTLWNNDSSKVTSLGATSDSEDAGELIWESISGGVVTLGTKDEDHRSKYGVVIFDPKSNGASDEVKLSIPGDQVQANIIVRGPSSTGATGAGETCTVADINPRTLLDSEVSNPSQFNLIVVGGPAINSIAETFVGSADDFRATYSPGEAIIRLVENGNRVAMVVAGFNAIDTRRAAKVLADHADYSLSGSEALVKGTSLTDITVE